ncbi:MAG: pyruvate dehydrogenase (acetyl-transferring) E1 component subunit alpha [Deltaproteobacteria bacterium]|nr:pyruvate dehydrogenase (acetyl-transferring) E1 component subunit alpha [Deltaproteobacteria bacterium]
MSPALPPRDTVLALLWSMMRIRRLEAAAAELYAAGKIRGFVHLYDGEEAVAVGTLRHLREDDAVVATYREHGHALARGITARAILAEMCGRAEGCSKGHGGSMHLFDVGRRFYGGLAIVGAGLPIAVGLALADKTLGRERVTACFFGEGAVAEGSFHESMNLAALWELPVLFVCENNLYAMGTALRRAQAATDLAARAGGYGVAAADVDGMDVVDVDDAVVRALAVVRSAGRPFFLECKTYRFRAHSMFDAQLYRARAEIEEWKARDPIVTLRARAEAAGVVVAADVAAIELRVEEEINDAVAFAEAGTFEPVEHLTRDVSTRAPRPGRITAATTSGGRP